MHYRTIKLNIKIPQNIHNCHFCVRICARSAPIFFFFFLGGGIFQISPPHPKNGSTPLFSPPPPHFKKASYALDAKVLFMRGEKQFLNRNKLYVILFNVILDPKWLLSLCRYTLISFSHSSSCIGIQTWKGMHINLFDIIFFSICIILVTIG